jgi:hypothetical protein
MILRRISEMKVTGLTLPLLAALCCAPLAHADFAISYEYSLGGGPLTGPMECTDTVSGPTGGASCGVVTPPSTTPTLSLDGGLVTVSGLDVNGLQAPGLVSQEQGSSVSVTNLSSQALKLYVWVSDSGFSTPVTPPSIQYTSSLDWTSTIGSGSVGLESCIDQSNDLVPPDSTFCENPTATITNPPQSFSGNQSGAPNTISTTVNLLSAPFSLSQLITVSVSGDSISNFVTTQSLTSVPEPMSITLLGAVIFLSGVAIRRKRKLAEKS